MYLTKKKNRKYYTYEIEIYQQKNKAGITQKMMQTKRAINGDVDNR